MVFNFTIDELILIKEGLMEVQRKSEKRIAEAAGKSNCYDLLAKERIRSIDALMERLEPYGYGM